MFSPKSLPASSMGPSFPGHRKNSASVSGILSTKPSLSHSRIPSAYSHTSSAALPRAKPDLSINPFAEPSTPTSIVTSVRSRPVSSYKVMNDITWGELPTSSRGHKETKAQYNLFKISENKGKSLTGTRPKRPQSSLMFIEGIRTDGLEFDLIRGSTPQVKSQRSPKKADYVKKKSEPAPQEEKLKFIDVVTAKMKERKKEKLIAERIQEEKHIQETKEIVSKPIRHTDVELRLKERADIEAVEDYEIEVLGSYKNYRDVKDIKSTKVLRRINYLKLMRMKLREEKQEFILTMIKGRNSVRRALVIKDFRTVVEELKKTVKVIIKMDNVFLLLEILHLIGEAYLDFGQMDNAVFALNQLRMGAELADNIPKKIAAYMGLAETCKRLKYFDIALQMMNRALNFCWNILDRETELKIYDEMGLIYFTTRDMDKSAYYHNRASQGRLESENSPLFIMANELIKSYRLKSHLCLQHLAPVFFSKLTIPHLRKKSVMKTKQGRQKLRALLGHNNNDSQEEHIFEDEATLDHASAFLEKIMSRAYYKQGLSQSESPTLFNAINIGVPALDQLEVMMAEPDFTKEIPSPRTYDIKEKLIPEKQSKAFYAIRDVKNEGFLMGNLDTRRKVIDARDHHNLKKDTKKYSVYQIARENHLTLKAPNGDLIMPVEQKDLFMSFETIKQKAKKEFTSESIESKMFLNHLSPNRCTHGIPNVPEVKPSRYHKFFDMALEHIVNDGGQNLEAKTS